MSRQSNAPAEGILTAEASGGLSRELAGTSVSRRSFLVGAGALVVLFSAKGRVGTAAAQEFEGGGGPGAPSPNQLDSWIAIGADGKVTAYTGKEEIGQGISTAQIQLVAEELCVPFSQVNLIYCDTALTPDQGITSGSQSHPTNFNHRNLALAAATARETLVELASKRLGMPADQLMAADGVISVEERFFQENQLWRIDQGAEIRDPAESERQAEACERMDRAGDRSAAPGSAGVGHGTIRVCAQCAAAGDVARARGETAGSGRDGRLR